jgi:hypothetical protein
VTPLLGDHLGEKSDPDAGFDELQDEIQLAAACSHRASDILPTAARTTYCSPTEGGQVETSRLQSSDFIQLAHEIVPLREDALGPLVDDLARRCELAAMADAIEQRYPNLILELLDRLADRRLCRGHGFGGPREAALPYDLDENAQRPKLIANSIAE